MESTMQDRDDLPTERRLPQYAGLTARGFAMGSADVVPGVSGGTMAFILGIYEELIMSIRMIGQPQFWNAVVHFRIGEALRLLNWKFLAAVFVGIFAAILTLAPLIEYLLVNQPVMIWSFFFGLVVASVIVVSGRVKRWNPPVILALLAGTAFAFWIVGLVPVQTPDDWWFLLMSGALASSAMILPGISGSFILLLLGKYEFVINAVNTRDVISLGFVAIGAAVGLVTVAQILAWLFKRYHDLTVAVLIGFMAGSLRKIWPWKEVVETAIDRHGEEVPIVLKNVLPPFTVNGAFNVEILAALGIAAVGFTAVVLLERIGNHTTKH
jgi:putative membrane protein